MAAALALVSAAGPRGAAAAEDGATVEVTAAVASTALGLTICDAPTCGELDRAASAHRGLGPVVAVEAGGPWLGTVHAAGVGRGAVATWAAGGAGRTRHELTWPPLPPAVVAGPFTVVTVVVMR